MNNFVIALICINMDSCTFR